MSKHHKNHEEEKKSSNPFATDETENTVNIEDTEETSTEDKEIVEEKDEKTEKETETQEKKGILGGLFGNKSEEELKKTKEAYETLNNQYLRLAADFDNYRKRQESERENLIKFGTEQALKKMIELADNFDRAEKAMEKIDDCEKAKESFNILNKQFRDALTKLGLEQIKTEGEKFDPNLHEAVMQVPTDEHPEETVMQEMQKGYKFGDKVLRASMVSVAVGK
ncbi:MAG: nucleotide exchange factor GrpE [bacterium]|nr:nucleotide exchange factor GrpE [bacterium]